MEVNFDLSTIFGEQSIGRLNQEDLYRFHRRRFPEVANIIDRIGKLSAEARGMKRSVTSYERLLDADDHEVLYLQWQKHPNNDTESIIGGMLKIGYRTLYLFDKKLKSYQTKPLCILDFYVFDSMQKAGHGHALFEYMLEHEHWPVEKVAIDNPSEAFLNFLEKHYHLSEPIWQSTKFVVFEPLFSELEPADGHCEKNQHDTNGEEKYLLLKEMPKLRSQQLDTVSNILQDSNEIAVKKPNMDPETAQGRKNVRDFSHQTLW
ncbi:hypothetical protein AB6A40_000463 [Gnathostoma spinigerum]|uniref:Alpha-tubulin N-acetyltransferase n=1 Tax=Gnathostoma spinigerum TaxID=75299 RepID=A0ABD6E258_9BILA